MPLTTCGVQCILWEGGEERTNKQGMVPAIKKLPVHCRRYPYPYDENNGYDRSVPSINRVLWECWGGKHITALNGEKGDKNFPEGRRTRTRLRSVTLDGTSQDRPVEFDWACRVVRLGKWVSNVPHVFLCIAVKQTLHFFWNSVWFSRCSVQAKMDKARESV